MLALEHEGVDKGIQESADFALGRIRKAVTPIWPHAGTTPIPKETSFAGEIIDYGDQYADCDDDKHEYSILHFLNPNDAIEAFETRVRAG
jgi:hypothetical protein